MHGSQPALSEPSPSCLLSPERVAEVAGDLAWALRADGAFHRAGGLAAFVGRAGSELAGLTWAELLAVDDPEAADRWSRALFAGEVFALEHRLRRSDGTLRRLASRAVPRLSTDGSVDGWTGVSIDLGPAGELSSVEETPYKTLADTLPQMVWSARPDGYHDYFNQRWYDYTGVPPGSTDGEGWAEILHPDDRPLASEKWQRSLETGEIYQVEHRLRRRDGVYRWVLGRALPVRGSSGRIRRWFGTCTDIDDLKRAEAALHASELRFRTLVEATDQVVWSRAPSGDFVNEQPGWSAFTGQPYAEHAGKGWLDAVHPDDRARAAADWARAVAEPRLHQSEHRLRRADGEYRLMLVRAVPMLRPDGTVEEWVGIHTDVTDLKNAEAELRRLAETLEAKVEQRTTELVAARIALERINRDLERIVATRTADLQAANEEIKRFAYIVSHDLRAPLVNIMGFTSELETSRETLRGFYRDAVAAVPGLAGGEMQVLVESDFDEALGFIRASTAKMDRLINAILALSRAERRTLQPEPIAMKPFLEAFKDSLAHQLIDKNAELVVEDVPDVVADRLALEQIFANLVENGVKYLEVSRPGRVVISGHDDGSVLHYTVADNGRGIDPKDFERIFELFRRAGVQDTPGEGIGLAHVRALARKLGGRVDVSSVPGEGSAFTVTLPKVQHAYQSGS